MKRSGLLIAVLGVILLAATAVIALRRDGSDAGESSAPFTAVADTQWTTIEGVEFPAGMERADPEVLEAYVFAAKHPEVLQHMPCYCGCEDPQFAHESNYDCFIDIIDRTGAVPRVSPDAMGFS